MPANASGWFWHSLARETGKLGHLYSPGAQRGPWPWLPYAFDNGAFPCWNPKDNSFDDAKWSITESAWRRMLFWHGAASIKARWAIVPDRPGKRDETIAKWQRFAPEVIAAGIPTAIAVQNGMTPADVHSLEIQPAVICVGGSTEWKWATVEMWADAFPRVHVLRCNAPDKLAWLESIGVESCDGTGWNRGDRTQTSGLERWARTNPAPTTSPLWPYVCREAKDPLQLTFA